MPQSAAAPGIDSCNRWGERACADALAELLPLVRSGRELGRIGDTRLSKEQR
jgi:hypothetical protein